MMAIHKPSIRLGQGKYCSTTAIPGLVTLGKCPRVVSSQGGAPCEVQEGLDIGACNHCTADSLPTLTNAPTGISGIQHCLAGQWHCSGSPDQIRQAHMIQSLGCPLKGSAKNAQSPLYMVGPRYIKCPFLRFGPDISTSLFYASAQIY